MKKFTIFHFPSNPKKGFTLIEMLVVISMVAIIGSLVVTILVMTLRGSNKAELISTLKQNGNAAMAQMVRQIRYAKSLDTPSSCITPVTTQSLTTTSLTDDQQTTFTCVTGANSTIASNGASLLDTTSGSVSTCSFVCSQQNIFDPPSITIQFTLTAKNANQLEETQATVPFQTTVKLRNYNSR